MVTGCLYRKHATVPSFTHQMSLRISFKKICEEMNTQPGDDDFFEKMQKAAKEEYWVCLKPYEYWFARAALRGGRTDMRRVYKEITPEEFDQGKRIHYRDINSSYPYQQVANEFPVGVPEIYVWNSEFLPCHHPSCTRTFSCIRCQCPEKRFSSDFKIKNTQVWNKDYILQNKDSLFGFFAAKIKPCKTFHPILMEFKNGKCIAPCYEIEGVFTSIEFIRALEIGYEIIELQAFHKYKKKPSYWADALMELYIQKTISSKNEPTESDLEKTALDFKEKFTEKTNEEIGSLFYEKFLKTKGTWAKRPAMKRVFKTFMNCMWGKQAEAPLKATKKVLNLQIPEDQDTYANIWVKSVDKQIDWKTILPYGDNQVLLEYEDSSLRSKYPIMESTYVPLACFVTAYGRMQLWEELYKLGESVLMNDTDSIVYVYDPEIGNEITQGDLLGDWEAEDVETKHGGITEFIGCGPKSYSIKCKDGFTYSKAKGISVNHAAQSIINHDSMKKLATSFLETNKSVVFKVPQRGIRYDPKTFETFSYNALKDMAIRKEQFKGIMQEGKLFPFGYFDE